MAAGISSCQVGRWPPSVFCRKHLNYISVYSALAIIVNARIIVLRYLHKDRV